MEKIGDILPWLERAYLFGLRDKHICELAKISPGTMSRAKNGSDVLGAQDWLDCKNLILDCEELSRRNSLPINWTDLRAVRLQLDMLRNEKKNPPGQPSEQDLDIFRRFVADEDLSEIAIRYRVDKGEILSRIERIIVRSEFVSRKAAGEVRK